MPKRNANRRKITVRNPNNRAKKNKPSPTWDLYRDGLTYSLLSKFFVCRERFRLSTVEGWSETGLQSGLEFGSAFHACLEKLPQPPEKTTQAYQRNRILANSLSHDQLSEFEVLMAMVEAVVYGYEQYWSADNASMAWVSREEVFDLPYEVDMLDGTSRTIRLRGKWDGVYRETKDDNKLWILETKTKSDIDQDGLQRTLSQDLQTMMYVTAVQAMFGERVHGVLYNVIRRPGLRLRQNESLREFSVRLRQDVLDRRDFYFHRWVVSLERGELETWQRECFDPLLRTVVQWWESIKDDPFEPWKSPYHFRRPFGIYDGLAAGRRGDFFNLLTTGSHTGLRQRSTAFPELEGE